MIHTHKHTYIHAYTYQEFQGAKNMKNIKQREQTWKIQWEDLYTFLNNIYYLKYIHMYIHMYSNLEFHKLYNFKILQTRLEWIWQYGCDLNVTCLGGPKEGQGWLMRWLWEKDFIKSQFLAMRVSSVLSSPPHLLLLCVLYH